MNLLLRLVVSLISSAVAFVVADVLLDDFVVSYPLGLIIPVVLFTVATVLLGPVVSAMIEKYATWASIAVGLIITFLALLITDLVSDKLTIEGVGTWVIGTAIVWLASIVTALVAGRTLRPDRSGN
jgi:hypothetical protein